MEPVHVSLKCWRRHLFAGGRLEVEAHLINDDPTREAIPPGQLAWVLADTEGAAIAEGRVFVPSVPYYGIESVPIELEVPDISAPGLIAAALTVRWLADEGTLSANTLELLLAPGVLRRNVSRAPAPRSSCSTPRARRPRYWRGWESPAIRSAGCRKRFPHEPC